MKLKEIPIGKKVFAKYTDDYNEMAIHFIPTYIIEENDNTFIGIKNNSVGTEKGYYDITYITGQGYQLNKKHLTNIHIRKHKD